MGLAGVVPIILNCYVGHQSVHGIMGMLKPYTPGGGCYEHTCTTRPKNSWQTESSRVQQPWWNPGCSAMLCCVSASLMLSWPHWGMASASHHLQGQHIWCVLCITHYAGRA